MKDTCPKCGKVLVIKAEFAGKKGKCPACGMVFRIGSPSEAPAPQEPADVEDQSPGRERTCPSCGAEMPACAVICTQCGLDVRTGQRVIQSPSAAIGPVWKRKSFLASAAGVALVAVLLVAYVLFTGLSKPPREEESEPRSSTGVSAEQPKPATSPPPEKISPKPPAEEQPQQETAEVEEDPPEDDKRTAEIRDLVGSAYVSVFMEDVEKMGLETLKAYVEAAWQGKMDFRTCERRIKTVSALVAEGWRRSDKDGRVAKAAAWLNRPLADGADKSAAWVTGMTRIKILETGAASGKGFEKFLSLTRRYIGMAEVPGWQPALETMRAKQRLLELSGQLAALAELKPTQLCNNGGFEERSVFKDHPLLPWYSEAHGGQPVLQNGTAHSGKNCVGAEGSRRADLVQFHQTCRKQIPSWTVVTVSLFIRAENASHSPPTINLHISFVGHRDEPLVAKLRAMTVTMEGELGTYGFKQFKSAFIIPRAVDSLSVTIEKWGAGRVWFDDVSIMASNSFPPGL